MGVKIVDNGNWRIASYRVEDGKYEAIITDYERKVTVKEKGESEEIAIRNARKSLMR